MDSLSLSLWITNLTRKEVPNFPPIYTGLTVQFMPHKFAMLIERRYTSNTHTQSWLQKTLFLSESEATLKSLCDGQHQIFHRFLPQRCMYKVMMNDERVLKHQENEKDNKEFRQKNYTKPKKMSFRISTSSVCAPFRSLHISKRCSAHVSAHIEAVLRIRLCTGDMVDAYQHVAETCFLYLQGKTIYYYFLRV